MLPIRNMLCLFRLTEQLDVVLLRSIHSVSSRAQPQHMWGWGTCFRAGGQFLITKKEEEEERGKELETTTKKTERQNRHRTPPRQGINLLCIYHAYAVLEY